MRKQSKAIRVVLTILAGAFVVAALTGPANTPKTAIMHPPLVTPAVALPSPSPEPTTQTGIQPPEASPSTAASSVPATPVLTAADKRAQTYAAHYWAGFVLALEATSGDKLNHTQLIMPQVVPVKDMSGCPPGLYNLLPDPVKNAMRFCRDERKIRVISAAFNKLSDHDQQRAVAGAFIYHALFKATAQQLANRNETQVLGCLQASLSVAYDEFGGGEPEDVWVVMTGSRSKVNEDLWDSYHATEEQGGDWG